MNILRLACALSVFAGCAAAPEAESWSDADAAVGTATAPIVGGTNLDAAGIAERGLVGLVAQTDSTRSGYCSGTLVADRIVLTAAHCAATPRGPVRHAVFAVDIFGAPRTLIPIASFVRHRTADIAVAHLATNAPANYARIPVATLRRSHAGAVEIAGFGRRDPALPASGGVGARLAAYATFAAPGSPIVTVNATRAGGCAGDSGGPVFLGAGARRSVLGALSNGNPSCRGGDTYMSASFYELFLRTEGAGAIRFVVP